MLSAIWLRRFQYAFIAIIVTTVGFSLYQWNASRASTQKTAPNNGLVGYWSFDEGSGTQAGDASGNNNTGTLTNGPTWVSGKLGQAINFDGTDDAVSAPINLSGASVVSVSFWLKWTAFANDDKLAFEYTNNFNSKNGFIIDPNTGSGLATGMFSFGTSKATPQTYWVDGFARPSVGVWHHYVLIMNRATPVNAAYVDGVVQSLTLQDHTASSMGNFDNSSLYFMSRGTTSLFGNGALDEVRVYNRALSGTEITNLYNLGAEKLNVSPTSNLTSGLVGYWTFDGKDTPWSSSSAGTATDRSGNSNTGTLTNMSRTTTPAEGKLGQALNFDGVDDYVDAGTGSSLDITGNLVSISAWIYPRSFGGNSFGRIVDNGSQTSLGYFFAVNNNTATSAITFGVASTNGSSNSNVITLNKWQHVVVTYDASIDLTSFYVNGVAVGTSANNTVTPPSATGTYHFNIGARPSSALRYFDGLIDDTRIYNRALSAGEVQSLYDLGASDKVNSSVSQNQGTGRLDSGLAGYWKLDDASGTTATDSSVNAFNGTLTNGAFWNSPCPIRGCVSFDGVNDYIDLGNRSVLNLTNNFTVSLWAYINNVTQPNFKRLFGRAETDTNNRPFYIEYDYTPNQYRAVWRNAGTYGSVSGKTLTAVGWQHFVVTFKDGVAKSYSDGILTGSASGVVQPVSTSSNTYIGDIGTGYYFPGNIDEVRVYNRALSDDEVSQLYRLTAPTGVDTSLKGYWSFDGSATNWTSSSAGTVSDLSGSGNTGTLTNMSRATSPAEGKLGQALTFDGVNDYVVGSSVPYPSFSDSLPITVSAWVKTSYSGGAESIAATWNYQNTSGWRFAINANVAGKIDFATADSNSTLYRWVRGSTTVTDGNWHFVTVTYDGSGSTAGMKLSVDSVLETVTSINNTAPGPLSNSVFNIGKLAGIVPQYFNGSIDEVRVYNRALSAPEITALYNSGR